MRWSWRNEAVYMADVAPIVGRDFRLRSTWPVVKSLLVMLSSLNIPGIYGPHLPFFLFWWLLNLLIDLDWLYNLLSFIVIIFIMVQFEHFYLKQELIYTIQYIIWKLLSSLVQLSHQNVNVHIKGMLELVVNCITWRHLGADVAALNWELLSFGS